MPHFGQAPRFGDRTSESIGQVYVVGGDEPPVDGFDGFGAETSGGAVLDAIEGLSSVTKPAGGRAAAESAVRPEPS